VLGRERPAEAIDALRRIAVPSAGVVLHRVAGFELVQLLDRLGQHREAFELATSLHAATTPPYDLEGLLLRIREQCDLLARGTPWFTPRAEPVQGIAMVVGLPRSGTTLLEQMLDRHPAICGIGEYEGIDRMGDAVVSTGRWPRGLGMMRPEVAARVQAAYTGGLPRLRRPDATWTFDKTLSAWMWLPAVACFLPGAVCLHVERDPRDTAISMFLSFFNPRWYGWMSSLDSIRRVIDAERAARHPARIVRVRSAGGGPRGPRTALPGAPGAADGRRRPRTRGQRPRRLHAQPRAGPAADQRREHRAMAQLRLGV
jgi:hypothetical protein